MGLRKGGKYKKKRRRFFTPEDWRSLFIGFLLILIDKGADHIIRMLRG